MRRYARLKISLPATVSGSCDGVEWKEDVRTVDISVGDIGLLLPRTVAVGEVLVVELPFPVRIKGRGEEVRRVNSVVRRLATDRQGQQLVGLEFVEAE